MAGTRLSASAENIGLVMKGGENFMKNWYHANNQLEKLITIAEPVLGWLKTENSIYETGGNQIVRNILDGKNPNTSKTFTEAQKLAKSKTASRKQYMVTIDEDHAVGRIKNQLIYSSMGDRAAFINLLKNETDLLISAVGDRRGTNVWSNGKATAGIVGSISGKTITLKDPSESTAFDIGHDIEFYSPAGTQRGNSAVTVTRVERDTTSGKVTFSQSAPSGIAANDEIYLVGDFGRLTFEGFPAWLPTTAPVSTDNFLGMNRFLSPERLAGVRKTMGASETYGEFFRKCATANHFLLGDHPDTIWMNPVRFNDIVTELGDKVRYNTSDQLAAGHLGFSGVIIHGPKHQMKLMTSPRIKLGVAYGLKMGTWTMHYTAAPGNKYIDFVPGAGGGYNIKGKYLAHDGDGVEIRVESYMGLSCTAPGVNFVGDLSAKIVS